MAIVVGAKSLEVNKDSLAVHFARLNVVNDTSLQVQDKLGQLPDELLVSILSLISYKEAARTSVLSCRWKKLWTFIPVLDFDASSTLFYLREQWMPNLRRERSKFVNSVDGVLDSYQGSTMKEFRVRFDLDLDNSNDIQRWVNFALKKKVQSLVLNLCSYYNCQNKQCRLVPPFGFPVSTSLRFVHLSFVDISGEVVGDLLTTCRFLEHLSVKFCDLLVDVKVDVPLLRLKYLDVKYSHNIRSIDILAPNLLTFECFGPKFIIPFEKIPKVTQVFIGYDHANYILFENPSAFSNFTQLETLTLHFPRIQFGTTLAQFPKLPHLKNLELIVSSLNENTNLLLFTPLVKSSPCLETFKMTFHIYRPNYQWTTKLKGKKCRLKNLKLVEIIGFRGCSIDNAFTSYLIKNSVMLEKFIINPRQEDDGMQVARHKAVELKHKFPNLEDKILVL